MKSMMIPVKQIGLFSDVPIRILDWDIWGKTIPQPRKTLVICSSESAETTKIIKEWHEKVNEVLKKRGLSLVV